ncbi:MAG: LysR family transcriptional regulator [Deltaproteobacteria bacterium]|nr:LysR family transcriptional regulator [Deltaproteobacteria bacterium]
MLENTEFCFLDGDRLRTFLAFSTSLNFTRTGEALHLSQPAVIAQVQKLQVDVGMPLYRREGRQLLLTEVGEELVVHARQMGLAGAALRRKWLGGDAGQALRLATGEGALLTVLEPGLRQFAKLGHSLKVQRTNALDTIALVHDVKADFGCIGGDELLPDSLVSKELARAPMKVVVGAEHALASKKWTQMKSLLDENWVLPPLPSALRSSLELLANQVDASLKVRAEAQGWPSLLQLVRAGFGISIVNADCAVPGGVTVIPLRGERDAKWQTSYRLLRRRDAPKRIQELFSLL